MTRWTILAMAFAAVACSEGERDRLSKGASGAVSGVDSALRADTGATETGAAGGAATEGAMDTAVPPAGAEAGGTGDTGGAGTAGAAGAPSGAEAMGGTPTATARVDLSADQVKQLQTALNDAGCDAGSVDGVVGPRTRNGIACGLDKNNLSSDDLTGLYRALNLDF